MKVLTDKLAAGIQGHRKFPRYAVPWRVVIVYKRMGKREMYRGKIADLSVSGISIFTDINIHSTEPIVATIEIPPYLRRQNKIIAGVRCHILLSILSSNYGMFRIVLKIIDFDRSGKRDLTEALSSRIALSEYGNFFI